MEKAVTWIRDGTLIDRMPENAVAFALAVRQALVNKGKLKGVELETLVNWAFEHSGVSAVEKMTLFNAANSGHIEDIEEAGRHYATLAEKAGGEAAYFGGVVDLIQELVENHVKIYITSAVRQEILEAWGQTTQGQKVAPYLELLGDGYKGKKSEGHFKYIQAQGATQIYSVADARSEIQAAAAFGNHPIGFANVITSQRIEEAYHRMKSLANEHWKLPPNLRLKQLRPPTDTKLLTTLSLAGAKTVVRGSRNSIVSSLRGYFKEEGLLKP